MIVHYYRRFVEPSFIHHGVFEDAAIGVVADVNPAIARADHRAVAVRAGAGFDGAADAPGQAKVVRKRR